LANDCSTLRVALVDDDESVRRALRRVLRLDGLSVETFGTASEFMESCPDVRFDCIVLDVHLGGISGLELLQRLRKLGCPVPVVIITAHDDAAKRERAGALSASAYLCKPFETSVFLDAVHLAVAAHPGHREACPLRGPEGLQI